MLKNPRLRNIVRFGTLDLSGAEYPPPPPPPENEKLWDLGISVVQNTHPPPKKEKFGFEWFKCLPPPPPRSPENERLCSFWTSNKDGSNNCSFNTVRLKLMFLGETDFRL